MKGMVCILGIIFFLAPCRTKEEYVSLFPGRPEVPSSIKREHESLLSRIKNQAISRDSSGILARQISETMSHHFKEEEEYVFPLLGILPMLAKGEVPGESQKLIGMMNHFTENSGHMIAEHQIIGVQLYELQRVSHDAGMKKFIEDVQAHAKMEEEILFPAAILAGEYLKIKTGKK